MCYKVCLIWRCNGGLEEYPVRIISYKCIQFCLEWREQSLVSSLVSRVGVIYPQPESQLANGHCYWHWHKPLIGPEWSRDLDTGFWLVTPGLLLTSRHKDKRLLFIKFNFHLHVHCIVRLCNFICYMYKTWLFSWEEDEDHMLFSWSYECLWWTCWNVTWSFSWWYFYCFMDHFMLSVYLHSFMVYINTVLQIITGIIWAGGRGLY